MDWKSLLFDQNEHLDVLSMSIRAIFAFFSTLLLLRIAGVRTLGQKSAFDWVIMIMLGSIFARAVVGANAFLPVLASCFTMVLLHRLIGWLCYYSDFFGYLLKGKKRSLYANNKQNEENMKAAMISKKDMEESVRLQINRNSFEGVEEIFLERTGETSVIKKSDE